MSNLCQKCQIFDRPANRPTDTVRYRSDLSSLKDKPNTGGKSKKRGKKLSSFNATILLPLIFFKLEHRSYQ